MEKYFQIISDSYTGYFWYLYNEILHPHSKSYIIWLLGVSLFFFALEWVRPWREDQPKFRQDFWMDFFYMFFNFFLFSLVVFNAASNVFNELFNDFLSLFDVTNLVAIQIDSLPFWWQVLILFFIGDFLSWLVHNILHRVPFLWEFHKVHHSVEQMGFAAHLRYHWMENIVYSTLKYLPLAMIGYGITDLFILHIFTLAIGHYNHSNITVSGRVSGSVLGALIGMAVIYSYDFTLLENIGIFVGAVGGTALLVGPFMKIIFNSPELHIWHHSYELPETHPHGVNFAITLAIWDYLFRTSYLPYSGKDIRLGFPKIEDFPKTFGRQLLYGFRKKK